MPHCVLNCKLSWRLLRSSGRDHKIQAIVGYNKTMDRWWSRVCRMSYLFDVALKLPLQASMSLFVKCPLSQLLSPRISSLPPMLSSQAGGTKMWGEETRRGNEDVRTQKWEEGMDWVKLSAFFLGGKTLKTGFQTAKSSFMSIYMSTSVWAFVPLAHSFSACRPIGAFRNILRGPRTWHEMHTLCFIHSVSILLVACI